MSKLNVVRKCYSCGAILQSKDKKKPGYIESERLDNDAHLFFCDACYKKEQYDLVPNHVELSNGFLTMLADAHATDALIVYVLDLFSFEATFDKEITKRLVGRKILVVGTKRDLLPKNVDDKILKEDIAHRLRREKINTIDIILTSATTELNIKEIMDKINELRKGHDVYIIGGECSGKTYLVNAILKNYKNNTIRQIKTMEYPGTSMSIMQIPLDKNSTMYNTDGIKINNSIINHVDKEAVRILTPRIEIKEKNYRLSKDCSLFIGGIARFDFIEGSNTHVYTYFSRRVEVKRISSHHIDEVFNKMIKKKNLLPVSSNINSNADLVTYEIKITEKEERDIGVQGLGWISFMGNEQTFRVSVPKGVGVYSCRAKILHAK